MFATSYKNITGRKPMSCEGLGDCFFLSFLYLFCVVKVLKKISPRVESLVFNPRMTYHYGGKKVDQTG